jgi:hypothetical protein
MQEKGKKPMIKAIKKLIARLQPAQAPNWCERSLLEQMQITGVLKSFK